MQKTTKRPRSFNLSDADMLALERIQQRRYPNITERIMSQLVHEIITETDACEASQEEHDVQHHAPEL